MPSPTTAPGPKRLPVFGSLLEWRRDPIGLLTRESARHGDVISLKFGPLNALFLRKPEHIQRVLLDNYKNYSKQTMGWRVLREWLGQGLLTSEGDFWLRQRRIAQPAFHRARIAGFASVMTQAAADMAEKWTEHAAAGRAVDVDTEMMRLTLRIVGLTLLSTDVSEGADVIGRALPVILHETMRRITRPYLKWFDGLPMTSNARYWAAIRSLNGLVLDIIRRRREQGAGPDDLLGMLMAARDEETGETMSDAQLLDEVKTIFLAGHETTANALSWTWYLLSEHPDVEKRLRAELDGALAGRLPGLEDLPNLVYTEMVIKEAMRLYPPIWIVTRKALGEDEIGGFRVSADSFMVLSPFMTHRHPDLWKDPERFDPERFASSQPERPRFDYFPFGGGPRLCIGNGFAMMEAKLLLATLAQRFSLRLVPGHPVALDPVVTLRPKHGFKMTFQPVD